MGQRRAAVHWWLSHIACVVITDYLIKPSCQFPVGVVCWLAMINGRWENMPAVPRDGKPRDQNTPLNLLPERLLHHQMSTFPQM